MRKAWLAPLLALLLVVPTGGVDPGDVELLGVRRADGVVTPRGRVVWVLALGSDARPGQPVTRSRADAIQLVGVDAAHGRAVAIGIPRDSWVPIPGHGVSKINAAMAYGGPQLMARTVGALSGVRPDYVVVADFFGFADMVNDIGGITVRNRYRFTDPVRPKGYARGRIHLRGLQAMVFARIRKAFPRGDFDRSRNQQETLRGILRQVRSRADRPGFMERGVLSAARHLRTDVGPVELYRLAQAFRQVPTSHFRGCVARGSTGTRAGQSVVFVDRAQVRRLVRESRRDARFSRGC